MKKSAMTKWGAWFPTSRAYRARKLRCPWRCGRTGNNRVVNFPASDVGLIGRMANVEIVEVLPNSLRVRLL